VACAAHPGIKATAWPARARMTKTIVVADDNPASRELMRELLESSGYRVVEAADGNAALEKTLEVRPDLVVLDIELPTMSGFEVLDAIRQHPELSSLPVVAVTARAMEGDLERGVAAGFDAYITKPIKIAAARAQIRELLEEKQAASTRKPE
jgi:CheY-like chemotaxis protein